ncbi:hypothetical protein [Limnohabitans sp. Jir72]|nr:hypothetical protein [Limnohabitans sp. Jir72]
MNVSFLRIGLAACDMGVRYFLRCMPGSSVAVMAMDPCSTPTGRIL